MRGPGLDTIHSALRLTAFDLPVDDSDLARACLLGAEVLGIQDPIDEMQLGHLRAPDQPSAARRRLASRPSSGLWTDPPPPSGAKSAPVTPRKSPLRSVPSPPRREASTAEKEKAEEIARVVTPPPQAQTTPRRSSGPRKARPSYPPQSPSQRARSTSVSISPPRTLSPAQSLPPPRAPSPRPKSTSPTPSPAFTSILDRPHPRSQQRPRSVSPPSSILVTPTETTFILPTQVAPIPFPVPKPTPPTSPTSVSFADQQSQPRTPTKPPSKTDESQRTPTQKSVTQLKQKQQKQRPVTLHSIQYHDLADLARLSLDEPTEPSEMKPPPLLKLATQGKRPVYGSANAQFSALVLVKSNTPSIYGCAAGSASCSSLVSHSASIHHASISSRGHGHMRTQSHGAPRTPTSPRTPRTPHTPGHAPANAPGTAFPGEVCEVPSISVTAPTPSSPRFSFSSLFPPKAPKSPLSPQKRPQRQRRVSAEASQWAWGAKRGSRQSSAQGGPESG
ncbi:F5/8 type C domain protein [Trichosporon asahii var. asahii CBS 2479]|uniref:F5/8 type C domain protein n=1 Tax=Trichosporon asahii var. asahii (strain ATCC 90039 / CBS 2479 / JCM 2466 / KCTC 7840 / NBRC 103889/ NCYC 2677 / UAMH 7654) TaxID=1186058 RepID=J6EY38_TRIAS|nr:F5/8 type C domain protein [Trichosporon asahii var. asahii CBS 2479]EJT47757.1 F5/8 type C domain protein [Trichosporon asahii var. asahii CBS 2479]